MPPKPLLDKPGVYCIKNSINNKRYVGSTTNTIKGRAKGHLLKLLKGTHHNYHLQKSWNKYGKACFMFYTLEVCDPNDCLTREQFWIDKYDSSNYHLGYNISPTAGNNRGFLHSEATKQLMIKVHTGKRLSDETKRKISLANKGKVRTNEQRAKYSANNKMRTPEGIKRQAEFLRGRKLSKEHIQNIIKARIGRKLSEETKMKISKALTGKKLSDYTKRKLSKINLGKRLSETTKKKMSESQYVRWNKIKSR